MKKFQVLRMLLVAALMITALPMHAQAQSQKSPNLTFKQRAKKRFNESVTRFKRCLNRECTKGELAKAGKELIAAVGALIVVSGITYFVATRNKQTPLAPIPSQFKVGAIVAIGIPPFNVDETIDVYTIDDIDPQTGLPTTKYRYPNTVYPLDVDPNDTIFPINDVAKIQKNKKGLYFIPYKDLVPQVAPATSSADQPQFKKRDIVALIEKNPSNKLYVYVVDETNPLKIIHYEDRMFPDAARILVLPERLIPVTDINKIKEQNLFGDKSYYIENEE